MTIPAISALPTPPSRNMTPDAFITAADALMAALATFVTEVNAVGTAYPADVAAVIAAAASGVIPLMPRYAGAATGTADALVLTFNPAITAHTEGLSIYFKAASDNTGAVTVAINALGAVAVKNVDGSALVAGAIKTGYTYALNYNVGAGVYVIANANLKTYLDTIYSAKAGPGTLVDFTVGKLISNGQLAFPATQNPSADSNTLDDYERGTWTPVLGASGGTPVATTSGTYVKIGNLVSLTLLYTITDINGATGAATIGGFPFTVGNNGGSSAGRIGGTTGKESVLTLATTGTYGNLYTYDNSFPWATNANDLMTVTYII